MIKNISIINYDLSNMFSIYNAIEKLGFYSKITKLKKDVENSDLLILPGTGSFPAAMKNLKNQGLINPIKNHIKNGKPFLGICLGYQLLFSSSEEFENCEGLNIFDIKVKNLKNLNIKTPIIGWLPLLVKKENCFKGFDKKFFYFVHSYYVSSEKSFGASYVEVNNEKICSSIQKDNIIATQFHPEKSGKDGLDLLKKIINQYK